MYFGQYAKKSIHLRWDLLNWVRKKLYTNTNIRSFILIDTTPFIHRRKAHSHSSTMSKKQEPGKQPYEYSKERVVKFIWLIPETMRLGNVKQMKRTNTTMSPNKRQWRWTNDTHTHTQTHTHAHTPHTHLVMKWYPALLAAFLRTFSTMCASSTRKPRSISWSQGMRSRCLMAPKMEPKSSCEEQLKETYQG